MTFRSPLFALAACMTFALPSLGLAEGKSIIVLDASGSMWGQIDGRAKLEIAREALGQVLTSMPAETEIGLMAYGHREKGSCDDIELVVPPAAGTAAAITDAANSMNFLGKTPLSEAVRRAAMELKSTEEAATVILITDGIETCNADPCALGLELEQSGINFTAHVVGFGLTEEEGKAVACLAENTGGKYIQASDAGSLVDALKTTVAVVEPEPEPEPVPEPEPTPQALEDNVDPVLYLAEGGPEPDERVLQDAIFAFYPVGADGQMADDYIDTIYGRSLGAFPPGKYIMRTTLHEVEVDTPVEIGPADQLSTPTVVLDAGILNLQLLPSEGAEPDPDAFYEIRGANDLYESGYGQSYRVYPTGEHALTATLGAATVNASVVIDAGKTNDLTIILGTGLAVVESYYVEGMQIEGDNHFVEIFEAKKDIEGNRKSVGYTYGPAADFDLPAGDFVAVVSLGGAKTEVPFTVKVGERVDISAVLDAGMLAVTTPDDRSLQVVAAKADISGERKLLGNSFGPEWTYALPAGDYVLIAETGGVAIETPVTIKAGERSEVAVQ